MVEEIGNSFISTNIFELPMGRKKNKRFSLMSKLTTICHTMSKIFTFSENIRLNYFTTGGVILRGEGPISFLSLLERVTSVLEHVL